MADLLMELLSEEIPAGVQKNAANQLQLLLVKGMQELGLECGSVGSYYASRRLVVFIKDLPTIQADRTIERKGPRVSSSDSAIHGFLQSNGISLDDCELREDKKGKFYVAVFEEKGKAVKDLLASIIQNAILKLTWPKSMRWSTFQFRWVRPLQNILVVFDGVSVPGSLKVDNWELLFTNYTYGHRFLAPAKIFVENHEDYVKKLANKFVIIDPDKRIDLISVNLRKSAEKLNLTVRHDPKLVEEVNGLVEWPIVLVGNIDKEFMELPPEVLTASMRSHQKYFSLLKSDGNLAFRFAFITNMDAVDGGGVIISGNQRVLRSRLADAKHFWEQDRRTKLEDKVTDLDKVVFHAKLGTVGQKVKRIGMLSKEVAVSIPNADQNYVSRAALLAKADLVTGMVSEFPELQGVMGKYYALDDGEQMEVAVAIAEHYSPVGPADSCPTSPVSISIAIADKIDTLVSFWAINEKPTGSKDPYALRRAALGLIRIILENQIRLPLKSLLSNAGYLLEVDTSGYYDDLMSFIVDRLKMYLREEGIEYGCIEAIFSTSKDDDLLILLERTRTLNEFLATENGINLLIAYRRAANIVRVEKKKDNAEFQDKVYDVGIGKLEEDGIELTLWNSMLDIEKKVHAFIKEEKFVDAMSSLASLRQPVDSFFDSVTVNVDDSNIRHNRLRL
ncbi:MAG: glycine--tRNA ligase subunit beta, partial [Alphaproteobacteria bacterium]|nr:glycine--tRNA ligase subunit beta [Alphaproteobacteria bacterium]